MNTRAVFTVAIILSFVAGFMSANTLVYKTHQLEENTIISNNTTKIMALDDRAYYPVAMEKINAAKKSIHIVMFEMVWYGDPNTDQRNVSKLGKALTEASERGVDVKVILENGWSYGGFEYKNIASYDKNWTNYLEKYGVHVKCDWSNQTTHDKLIIIDDYVVIVGSTNWSQSALNYNHEANALIESKAVATEYENYFQNLWNMYQ